MEVLTLPRKASTCSTPPRPDFARPDLTTFRREGGRPTPPESGRPTPSRERQRPIPPLVGASFL